MACIATLCCLPDCAPPTLRQPTAHCDILTTSLFTMDLGVTAANALLLTSSEDWFSLGQAQGTTYTDNVDRMADGVTSLLLVRIIAMHNTNGKYQDLSTTTIASAVVNTGQGAWPTDVIAPAVVPQMRNYVHYILTQYQNVPFHNAQHAYHVVLCANKLLDQMLSTTDLSKTERSPPTYGLKSDPTALLALVFAALMHDVGHPGVSNRARANSHDEIAIRYNDQSIHENHALSVAFAELLRCEDNGKAVYDDLRRAMFPEGEAHYRYFRKMVIDAVLSTDLACPIRTQMARSKFDEAFPAGDLPLRDGEIIMYKAEDADSNQRRGSLLSTISKPRAGKNSLLAGTPPPHADRRGSTQSVSSIISDISTDSHMLLQQQKLLKHPPLLQSRRMSNQSHQSYDSMVSDYDSVYQNYQTKKGGSPPKSPPSKRHTSRSQSMTSTDSMLDYVEKALNGEPIRRSSSLRSNSMGGRRHSVESGTTGSMKHDELEQLRAEYRPTNNDSGVTGSSGGSYGESLMAAESIDLAQKRRKGQGMSRFRSQNEVSRNRLPGDRYTNYSDDDDLSLTPPSSDDEMEMEGVIITGANGNDHFNPAIPPQRRLSRRRSSAHAQNRRGSASSNVFNIAEEDPTNMNDSSPNLALEIEAKHNASAEMPDLGMRRTMDLSGESIDQYSARDSLSVCSVSPELLQDAKTDSDQPDEFRTSVLVELLLRIADMSYWFQNEDIFLKHSQCLLSELIVAHQANKGMDPRPKWVQNQLNMAEQYLAVLALQLQRTGVYGRSLDFWFPLPEDAVNGEWRFPSHVLVKPLTALR